MALSANFLSTCCLRQPDLCSFYSHYVKDRAIYCRNSLSIRKKKLFCRNSLNESYIPSSEPSSRSRKSYVFCQALPSDLEDNGSSGASDSNGKSFSQVEIVFGNVSLGGELSQSGAQDVSTSEPRSSKPAIATAGDKMVNILTVFNGLLERPFGSGQSIASAGYVVLERIKNDADSQCEGDKQQIVFELLRVVKLLTMDMDLVASAQKPQTLVDRLNQARLHCKQAISLARAL